MEANNVQKIFNDLQMNKPRQNNKKVVFDSYKQFLKYGINTTINILWSNLPKVENEDSREFTNSEKLTILQGLQKLEELLYKFGVAALSKNFEPAEVLDYVVINGELKYLKVKKNFESKSLNIFVIEEYKYDKNNRLVFNYSITKPSELNDKEALEKLITLFNYDNTEKNIIPFVVFNNNVFSRGDLDFVNNEYFELLNRDLEVLALDSYISAPWIFALDTYDLQNKIQKGLFDLSERFIAVNPRANDLYDQEPLRLLQSQSQSQLVINKIEKSVAWIKKFAFMKQDSGDFGTKNMHSAEVQEINSDFEDYLETKANLRELQLLKFFNTFYSDFNIKSLLICGSTKWLQTEAKKYVVNMNGSVVNYKEYQNETEIE
ncbi:htpn [[Mycoplasma] gypis]|uniref:htpn n=1 Tax=[Mycoplasma] gypis TaxID=92404 RepID=UPI0019676F0A|nr:htpn [[Mycoplasma] gypis]MBN0919679.1 htpn [[Mycoplasma] gypis]